MKEVISMWKNTRMIILVALSAAIYAAFLIVFKGGLVLVPGITEVRPANVFPPIFGLMFGPAGAWGSAIGNLIGDIFGGTFGIGSIFGFVGNFLLGFIPYKMWTATFGLVSKKDPSPTVNSGRKIAAFEIVALVSSAACAIWIAWFLDLTKIVPFAFLAITITLNNFLAAFILGPILLALLYPRVQRWGLIWTDIMQPEDVSASPAKLVGSILMIIGSLGGLIVGVLVAVGAAGEAVFGFTGRTGEAAVWITVLPFLIVTGIASFLFNARDQFVEEGEEEQVLKPSTP